MEKVNVELDYCYGIRKLRAEFDFRNNSNAFAVYAPNGVMKTSFANTFRDLSQGLPSSDLIWPERINRRVVVDESGAELPKDGIFVIEPYKEGYRSERISTLLVNEALRKEHETAHQAIDDRADLLVAELRSMAKTKDDIREELATAITLDRRDFYKALVRVRDEVKNGQDSSLGDVVYAQVFNPKVVQLLEDPEFQRSIRNYIEKYDELISKSTFFKKGVFTHNNAAAVAKNLSDNGFFKAQHSVYLRINGQKKEVSTVKELEGAIQAEKARILTDANLRSAFEAIDTMLMKNAELRAFRACLLDNPILLPELANPGSLKQKLWVAYLIRARSRFDELLIAYDIGKTKIAEIAEKARSEQTKWAQVVSIFNHRFSVPFVVRIDNQADVILEDAAPSIQFDFLDDPDDKASATTPVELGNLMRVLSSGERRALYLLNIIFEVEARKAAKQDTLFIVDDIADSFDYKNKYAIIEYLKELASECCFKQIILSHNFDFYRTVSGRLHLERANRMLAGKDAEGVTLQPEVYQRSSPFSHWRKHLGDETMLIASIPFLRNLAEYSGDDTSYRRLTALLHVKPDSDSITIGELVALVKRILHDQPTLVLPNPAEKVVDVIHRVSAGLVGDRADNYALEQKVALSIAIRLKAEEVMIRKIDDRAFWEGIHSNQTIALIERFKKDFDTEVDCIQTFERVNLMTPENIHLNSFMYEPILDLSALHLKELYRNLCAM